MVAQALERSSREHLQDLVFLRHGLELRPDVTRGSPLLEQKEGERTSSPPTVAARHRRKTRAARECNHSARVSELINRFAAKSKRPLQALGFGHRRSAEEERTHCCMVALFA